MNSKNHSIHAVPWMEASYARYDHQFLEEGGRVITLSYSTLRAQSRTNVYLMFLLGPLLHQCHASAVNVEDNNWFILKPVHVLMYDLINLAILIPRISPIKLAS